jgi:hypothetical protein
LLRLLAAHPAFTVAAVSSESQAGTLVGEVFPHLRGAFPGLAFASRAESLAGIAAAGRGAPLALFSAAPHGASAELVAAALAVAEGAGGRRALRRPLGGLPFRGARAVGEGVRTRARRSGPSAAVRSRPAGARRGHAAGARRASGVLHDVVSSSPPCRCCAPGWSIPA